MRSLFVFAIYISILSSKIINVVKLACDVKITEVPYSSKLMPAEATSGNITQLILALQFCNIKSAQVAGWNGHKSNYILHNNGALVPNTGIDYPPVALFFDRCGCDTFNVICVFNPENTSIRRCLLPTAVVKSTTTCCRDMPIQSETQSCAAVSTQPSSFASCPSPVPTCCQNEQVWHPTPQPITQITSCSSNICISKRFIYFNKKNNGNNIPYVLIINCADGSKQVVNLCKHPKAVNPRIFNNPAVLRSLKMRVEKILCGDVLMYVMPNYRMLFLFNSIFYKLVSCSSRRTQVEKITERELNQMLSNHVYSVEFC